MAVIPKKISKRKSKPFLIIDCRRFRDFKAGCDPVVELCIDSVSCERGGRPGAGTGRPCDTDHTWKLGVSQFSILSSDISHS